MEGDGGGEEGEECIVDGIVGCVAGCDEGGVEAVEVEVGCVAGRLGLGGGVVGGAEGADEGGGGDEGIFGGGD